MTPDLPTLPPRDPVELTAWLDALRLVRLVRAHPLMDEELHQQATRASWAAARNLERARARSGDARAHHLRIARQRVAQTASAYREARAAQAVAAEAAREVTETADRIAAQLSSVAHAA